MEKDWSEMTEEEKREKRRKAGFAPDACVIPLLWK